MRRNAQGRLGVTGCRVAVGHANPGRGARTASLGSPEGARRASARSGELASAPDHVRRRSPRSFCRSWHRPTPGTSGRRPWTTSPLADPPFSRHRVTCPVSRSSWPHGTVIDRAITYLSRGRPGSTLMLGERKMIAWDVSFAVIDALPVGGDGACTESVLRSMRTMRGPTEDPHRTSVGPVRDHGGLCLVVAALVLERHT